MKTLYVVLAIVTLAVFLIAPSHSLAAVSGVPDATDHGAPFIDGPFGARHVRLQARMAKYLDLSAEQMTQIQDLRKKHFADTRTLREELMERRVEMRHLFADSAVNDAAITAKAAEIGSLQQLLRDDTIRLRLEERKILTPDQLNKLSELGPMFKTRLRVGIGG
jgi:Spy/CpxP family protein refolding chaperone